VVLVVAGPRNGTSSAVRGAADEDDEGAGLGGSGVVVQPVPDALTFAMALICMIPSLASQVNLMELISARTAYLFNRVVWHEHMTLYPDFRRFGDVRRCSVLARRCSKTNNEMPHGPT